MERNYKFSEGQKVKMVDEESGGKIKGVVADYTRDTVFILWENRKEPTEHPQSDYHKIRLA